MSSDDDVPSSIDLRDPQDAAVWAKEADAKRPWRVQIRDAFADVLRRTKRPVRSVLELGSGPGLLAEWLLFSLDPVRYTLLDFSPPMLAMSRERVGNHPAAQFVQADFKQPGWSAAVDAPFDAVVTMQAVHEIRHKRHVPAMYRQIHDVLEPGGAFLVSDHEPLDDSPRMTSLHSTIDEQHAALAAAGFVGITTHVVIERLYLIAARRG